jgi:2-polyprenyl-3-methyl-5-hydroxy-6-metoxy-1,4-benzoquinol methylase
MNPRQQQDQTLEYFSTHAEEWLDDANDTSTDTVNVIKQRNTYVVGVIEGRDETGLILDVGCGTGDLVLEVAGLGIKSIGLDFSPEMISLSTEKASALGLESAQFVCKSIFDLDMTPSTYDCISAVGLIEYMSFDQLLQLLRLSYEALRPGGSFVVASRNRLFNAFSVNAFTTEEIESGAINSLLNESIAIVKGTPISELLKLDSPAIRHEEIGATTIAVSVRLQYTPVQLMKLLQKEGLGVIDFAPIHVHGIIPELKNREPKVHAHISNLLQGYTAGHRGLIPQSSSFIVHARKGI